MTRKNGAEKFVDRVSGLRGWKVRLPAGRPLATPAIANGRLFLGGGFGTYEFYALDAVEGHIVWQHHTRDDGPTAAVVEDGLLAYNTESCTLEVLTVEGKSVWRQWLGDPLMSMPAICGGRVYMAYPDSRGDHRHYLACFELRSGKVIWRHPITCDVITAPIIQDGLVYASCMDGTVFCLAADNGERIWQRDMRATSAPTVVAGEVFVSQRHDDPGRGLRERWVRQRYAPPKNVSAQGPAQQRKKDKAVGQQPTQRITETDPETTELSLTEVLYECPEFCAHLDLDTKRQTAEYRQYMVMDTLVGFSVGPAAAKFSRVGKHLGVDRVSAAWGFQGSRPCVYQGRLYAASGRYLRCLPLHDGKANKPLWQFDLYRDADIASARFVPTATPPVVLHDHVFIGTVAGDLFCIHADTGEVLWRVQVGEPISYQPAVAYGRVYVPTASGSLYAIETGSGGDDGWYMWGANAAHTNAVEGQFERSHVPQCPPAPPDVQFGLESLLEAGLARLFRSGDRGPDEEFEEQLAPKRERNLLNAHAHTP
ncbi:Serine/threonine-protein kinase AfsK [bacterium HR36]|nr:Serine/threonine-protein kinase AfsK [bacterium HR36]